MKWDNEGKALGSLWVVETSQGNEMLFNGLLLSILLPPPYIYESLFFKLSLISQEIKLQEDLDFILFTTLIPVSQRV